MSRVAVNVSSWCIDRVEPQESYGEWSETLESTINSVHLVTDNYLSGEHFEIGCNVSVGDILYILVITYSDGDSFGSRSGNTEVLWVFQNELLAERARKYVEENKNAYTFKFFIEDISEITVGNPASDYFSGITSIDIHELILEE